jgi:transposase
MAGSPSLSTFGELRTRVASLEQAVGERDRRVAFLEREVAERDRRIEALVRQVDGLKAQIERLVAMVQDLQRSNKRQASPFSKGGPKPDPQRPGRKPGARYGRRGERAVPEKVDVTYRVKCPKRCECGGRVKPAGTVELYEIDLPRVEPRVSKFVCGYGHCRQCQHRVQGRHPLQTSSAHEVGRVSIGPVAIGFAGRLKVMCGLSYGQTRAVLKDVLRFPVQPSTLCRALARLARRAEPTYQSLLEQTRSADVAYPDETGWRIGGRNAWAWTVATSRVSVFSFLRGRGYAEAASILGADFGGTLGADGWAPYRRFKQASLATCNAHLLRRCREILQTATRGAVRLPRAIKKLLQDGLALRDRRDAGEISPHGLKVAVGRLKARLNRLLDGGQVSNPVNARLVKHLLNYRHAVFRYLERPGVEATNWPAEHEMRLVARIRKSCAGNRTTHGARTLAVLLSVFRTGSKRGCDLLDLTAAILRAPVPRAHL